jgi:hypothetical protein
VACIGALFNPSCEYTIPALAKTNVAAAKNFLILIDSPRLIVIVTLKTAT